MPDEVTTSSEVKTASDGTVKIAVEKYNEMLEKITSQKSSISKLNEQLRQARSEPPVIHRTVVEKTPEMQFHEYRMYGGGLMGLGGSMFVVGVFLYKAGRSKS